MLPLSRAWTCQGHNGGRVRLSPAPLSGPWLELGGVMVEPLLCWHDRGAAGPNLNVWPWHRVYRVATQLKFGPFWLLLLLNTHTHFFSPSGTLGYTVPLLPLPCAMEQQKLCCFVCSTEAVGNMFVYKAVSDTQVYHGIIKQQAKWSAAWMSMHALGFFPLFLVLNSSLLGILEKRLCSQCGHCKAAQMELWIWCKTN